MEIRKIQREGEQEAAGEADTFEGDEAQWCRSMAARIGVGDVVAEGVLIKKLRPGLQLLLASRCRDLDMAADLCQETLVIVLKRLRARSLEDQSRIAAFAAQTARQLAFDTQRRATQRRTIVDSEVVAAVNIVSPDDESLDQNAVATFVRRLLAELTNSRDREVLRRFYLLEEDKSDICRELALNPGTFDQLIFRARARLRSMLDQRGVRSKDLLCVLGFWL